MRVARSRRILGRLAGAVAASGLVLTGLVATAGPASAAACSGTSGVTVVVERSGVKSVGCAPGDPSSAWKALEAAGHSVTPVQQFPGAICRIDGYPSNQGCVRMPPAEAYWAFFHANRGGSWTYSNSGATSYDPAPGTVVGFRFGSGGAPSTAPPAKTPTSTPKPTPKPKPTTAAPRPTTAAPKPTKAAPRPTSGTSTSTSAPKAGAPRATPTTPGASITASISPSASATVPVLPNGSTSAEPSPSDDATPLAAGPTSDDGSGNLGTLLAGAGLVALVAGGAGWAAWKRRGVTG